MSTSCYVYRCSAKQDMYIYLAKENDFESIDENLKKKLGELKFAMTLDLDDNTKLAKENPATILNNLESQGFHLQLPAETSVEEILARIAEKQNKS